MLSVLFMLVPKWMLHMEIAAKLIAIRILHHPAPENATINNGYLAT